MSKFLALEGKRVEAKLIEEEEAFTARVQKARAGAVLVKRSGKSQVELIEDTEFEFINEVEGAAKKIKAKRLNPVTLEHAKQHLIDRHGYQLASVNGMTDQGAFDFHEGLDHKEADLGHFHAPAPVKKVEIKSEDGTPSEVTREEAIAKAEAELVDA